MHLQEIFDLTLNQGQGHMKHCPLHHVTYVPAKFEVATANGKGDAFTRKYTLFELDPKIKGSRSYEILPSTLTSCDLCTSKD